MPEIFNTDLPHIMHEMIEDEVVVVNLESGTYYSLAGIGCRIWSFLGEGGYSLDSLVARVSDQYLGDEEQISAEVGRFIQQLRDEKIVNITESEDDFSIPDNPETLKEPFMAPVLEKYTDMEAMLLVDPIHEVNEAGWPELK